MDLRQLRSFLQIAESGSLSKASDRLRLAQPALSRQIRLLEAEVGLALFTRHGRGMQLTEAGRALLERVTGPLRQIERSVEEVRALASEVRGQVALGLMPTTSHVLSGRLARRVAAELPGVSLRIVEGYAGHLVEWLQRGQLDVSLLYGPGDGLHLRCETLLLDELALIGPAGALDGAPVSVDSLAALPMVLPSRPHGLRLLIETAASRAGAPLAVRFEADSFRVIKDLVAAGLGHSVLPPSSIAAEEAARQFSMAPLTPPIRRQILLVRPPDRADTRATGAVVALLKAEVAAMLAAGDWAGASPA
ncbi:LysR family transcriptional regulator [Roseomonas sp. USHLN139]|uniref:LysR family transcriptional regulator n=1 Tax=Roseomonas sp. USHLN139 TaxID=3081298 RepID=UPI003B02001B